MDASNLYSFGGRAGRITFALTQTGVFTATYVFTFLIIVLTGAGDESLSGVTLADQAALMIVAAAFYINMGWIALAVAVRRCHDRGLSGWMLLFVMPPILGQLWLVLSLITGEGQTGRNRFGRRGDWRDSAQPLPVYA